MGAGAALLPLKGGESNGSFEKCGTPERRSGALEVLKDVSLKVEKARSSIIGPSGGGKSTTLAPRDAAFETMDSGSTLHGENVAAREENGKSVHAGKPRSRRCGGSSGWCSSSLTLPHYTVLKNVCDAPISVQKRDRAEVEAEAMALRQKWD